MLTTGSSDDIKLASVSPTTEDILALLQPLPDVAAQAGPYRMIPRGAAFSDRIARSA
jgi:hypothetical protein